MAQIINLRMVRKAKKRAEAGAKATANRAVHGATRAQKEARRQEAERLTRTVEGARRERDKKEGD